MFCQVFVSTLALSLSCHKGHKKNRDFIKFRSLRNEHDVCYVNIFACVPIKKVNAGNVDVM